MLQQQAVTSKICFSLNRFKLDLFMYFVSIKISILIFFIKIKSTIRSSYMSFAYMLLHIIFVLSGFLKGPNMARGG